MDPLDVALREITEAKRLLERLIISSEQFDYIQARQTLGLLDKKIKTLAKQKALWQTRTPKDRIIPLPEQRE